MNKIHISLANYSLLAMADFVLNKERGVIMTTQEAIEIIKSNRPTSGYTMLNEALDIALDALERIPELEEKAWMYDECNK